MKAYRSSCIGSASRSECRPALNPALEQHEALNAGHRLPERYFMVTNLDDVVEPLREPFLVAPKRLPNLRKAPAIPPIQHLAAVGRLILS